jgi:hypothetical protein
LYFFPLWFSCLQNYVLKIPKTYHMGCTDHNNQRTGVT